MKSINLTYDDLVFIYESVDDSDLHVPDLDDMYIKIAFLIDDGLFSDLPVNRSKIIAFKEKFNTQKINRERDQKINEILK